MQINSEPGSLSPANGKDTNSQQFNTPTPTANAGTNYQSNPTGLDAGTTFLEWDSTRDMELDESLEEIGTEPFSSPWISATTLLTMPDEPPDQLLPGLFQRSGIAMIFGESDTGKSTFLRQLAVSIVAGKSDFLGFPIDARHRAVLFVSTEDGQSDVTRSLKHLQSKMGFNDQLDGFRLLFEWDDIPPIQLIGNELDRQHFDAVFLDCWGDLFEGRSGNDAADVRSFLKPFHALAIRHNTLFVFLHHSKKGTQKNGPGKDNAIGSQSLEAKARTVIELRKDETFDPDTRQLWIVKGNNIPSLEKKQGHVLNFSDWYFEPTGDRCSKCAPSESLNQSTVKKMENVRQASEQFQIGKKQNEIAKFLGVKESTISKYKAEYPELFPERNFPETFRQAPQHWEKS